MSQNFPVIDPAGEGEILTDLASMLERDEALRSHFAGMSAPSNPVVHQLWKDTTNDKWKVCTSVGPDVWADFLPFLLSSGGTLTGKLRLAEGAAIASAATVDLDAATGNFVHLTGTTTVTALTLAQGTQIFVCFDGALTVTHHATTLICEGGASIVTAAGDVALFVGEGSGATRMLGYTRANGRPLSALLAAIAGLDASAGVITQTGAGTVAKRSIGAGAGANILDRDAGDGRYQGLHALFTALAADNANAGLIEQTAPNTIAKRVLGVGASTSVPTRADADGRYLRQGSFNLSIDAGSWIPRPTNPCAAASLLESTSNKRVREVLNFDGASREYSGREVLMVKSYSGGTFKYRVVWECSGLSSGNAVFGLQAASVADGEYFDAAFGTAVEVTDAHNGAGKRMVTAWSADVTPSGTPAGGESMALQFYRKSDHADDTLNGVDVQVISVELLIPISAADDS